ncbi:MAG TPA: Hpt domain-containing protein, partial [Candidatus Limnocylindrales bacterium]|nr:Hpt domain-containing protein [Candidatus Limnocylindrales bacterium]
MSGPNQESVELFLQEASENLQYLREYSGLLSEPQTRPEDLEKLYIASHTLAGTSASYGFPHFSEVAAKMAHIFHYAMNASLTPDMHGPLTEFLSDAISVLEFDLLQISSSGAETIDDISSFKQRYAFAFPAAASQTDASVDSAAPEIGSGEPIPAVFPGISYAENLPEDGEVPDEVLDFFIPEAEEHLQSVTDCLLALEANPNPDDIHRLFRSMHTIKGSAAQVGLHRISAIAHRVEDLFGQMRDGSLKPNAEIVDLCLDAVDVLKKFLHRQWPSPADMAAAVDPLLARIAELVPEEAPEPVAKSDAGAEAKVETEEKSGADAARPAAAQ